VTHQLHLILQHDGFGIEEAKGNSWRLIKSKLISASVGREQLAKLANREQLTTYLEAHSFEPWFNTNPPINTNPRPIVLETRTLDNDHE
jgi:hypothetical protein